MDNSTNVARLAMKFRHQYKDMFFITLGIFMYAFGYTAFVLPEHVVMGGVAGISALLFYAFKLPPGITIWVLNLTMLVIAYRALSKQFVIRTIIGVTILSFLVGVLQPFFEQYPVITAGEDKFMHVLIGGALGGAGLGIVFSHNGSTGGTDIIVALLNKYTRMSFGRAMQTCDICIISSSYLLFHSLETIVYGVAFTLIASFVCDYVVNGTRQTVQFIIISKKYDVIADTINNSVHRGVTLIKGTGWYSKSDVEILIVLARKYESQEVFNLIKRIDPMAMVSQSFCQGVFGSGFDTIK
ncbi:MAG: YitT family protein [Prevotella sp.]